MGHSVLQTLAVVEEVWKQSLWGSSKDELAGLSNIWLRSDWASAQSHQSSLWAQWGSKGLFMCTAKALIRLGMSRLIWVFSVCTGYLVGFVMLRLICCLFLLQLKHDFMNLLKDTPDIDRFSLWNDVQPMIESDPRYQAVPSDSMRKKWFDEYIKGLEDVSIDM